MRNLFNFIIRHYFFFMFLALQVICFMLIAQNHHYQRSFLINSSNILTGNIFSTRTNIVEYFSLAQTNRQLARENANLHNQLKQSFLITDQQVFTFRDTVYQNQYNYINARVINNTVSLRNNYITLNKGRNHGIRPDMGVITQDGVIGIVVDVSNNFSSVLSFLHSNIQISAKIKKNDHLGTVIWEGYNYRKATMLYIPTHIQIDIGDTIVSSGFSHIFPQGVMIGVVSEYEIRRGDNFFTLQLELSRDFNNLDYVQVVKNIFREEQVELESRSRLQTR
jgi:rod shape-determining protein MreC